MLSYTVITSGGRKTEVVGYLSGVIASQVGRKTSVGIYHGTLLIAVINDGRVEIVL